MIKKLFQKVIFTTIMFTILLFLVNYFIGPYSLDVLDENHELLREDRLKYISYANMPLLLQPDFKYKQDHMFRILVETLNNANIRFWATKETALSIYKYKTLVPWEDQLSIAIHLDDLNRFKLIESDLKSKTEFKTRIKIRSNGYYFECVDLFNFNVPSIQIEIVSDHNPEQYLLHYNPISQTFLKPSILFKTNEIFPLEKHILNDPDCIVLLPGQCHDYLTDLYGKNWQVFLPWNYFKFIDNVMTRKIYQAFIDSFLSIQDIWS